MSSEVNLINDPKEIPSGVSAWDTEVSRKLAFAIAAKVDSQKMNMRIVQPKDHLLPILVGLSRGALRTEKQGGNGALEKLPVVYLGNSEQIQEQKTKNPEHLAIKANLIQVGQVIFLAPDYSRVFIADSVQDILQETVSSRN